MHWLRGEDHRYSHQIGSLRLRLGSADGLGFNVDHLLRLGDIVVVGRDGGVTVGNRVEVLEVQSLEWKLTLFPGVMAVAET